MTDQAAPEDWPDMDKPPQEEVPTPANKEPDSDDEQPEGD